MISYKFLEIFILFYLSVTQNKVSALRCFSCSITSQSSDQKCLLDPISADGQSVVNCNKKYCTILRQELKDPPGKINTFVRGCEEVPTLLDDVIEDPTFKTFYRSCSSDLCNGGDGIKSPGQEKLSPDGFKGENLLVPGLPFNDSTRITLNIFTSIIIAIAVQMFSINY